MYDLMDLALCDFVLFQFFFEMRGFPVVEYKTHVFPLSVLWNLRIRGRNRNLLKHLGLQFKHISYLLIQFSQMSLVPGKTVIMFSFW